MFGIQVYNRRDPTAVRIVFPGGGIFLLDKDGRLEKADYLDEKDNMRGISVVFDPFKEELSIKDIAEKITQLRISTVMQSNAKFKEKLIEILKEALQ